MIVKNVVKMLTKHEHDKFTYGKYLKEIASRW